MDATISLFFALMLIFMIGVLCGIYIKKFNRKIKQNGKR